MAVLGEAVRHGMENARIARDLTDAQLYCESKMAELKAGFLASDNATDVPIEAMAESVLESSSDSLQTDWLYSVQSELIDENGLMLVSISVYQDPSTVKKPVSFHHDANVPRRIADRNGNDGGHAVTRRKFFHHHSYGSRRGFTLIEVLLSLGLAALVLVALATAVDVHLRCLHIGRTNTEEAQLARALLLRIGSDLRSAAVANPVDASNILSAASEEAETAAGVMMGEEEATSTTGTSTVDTAMAAMVETEDEYVIGLYGESDWIQVDVRRTPRLDQYDYETLPSGSESLPDVVSGVKTVAYSLSADTGIASTTGEYRGRSDAARDRSRRNALGRGGGDPHDGRFGNGADCPRGDRPGVPLLRRHRMGRHLGQYRNEGAAHRGPCLHRDHVA